MAATPPHVTRYGEGSTFFHQLWQFFMSTTESELTRWRYELTSDERIKILQREENYETMLTHFCDSMALRDIPNATDVHGKCGVCRKYVGGCPAPLSDIGFADASNSPSPHLMLGSGLNCMPRAACAPTSWLSSLEALFTNESKLVSKEDLFLPDACNISFVTRNADGRVLIYMMYRYGLYVDFLKQHGQLTRAKTTVMEVGAGWGGFAALVKHMVPTSRYIILDIPTSLPLQMSYMHHLGHRNIVTLQSNATRADVKELLCCSEFDVLFILPHQIELLPDGAVDLTVNLDSMVEMPAAAIRHYLPHISRLSHAFYANNRQGLRNGWPIFRASVDKYLINNRNHPWQLVGQRKAPYTLAKAKLIKWSDHVMMAGKHTDLFLRRKA